MSQQLDLAADTSRGTGTGPSGRLRREGLIPAVLYGQGIEPVAVSVAWRELRQCLKTEAGTNAIINLDVDGSKHLSMVKDIQRHPVRREVIHVDFISVDPAVPVTVEVPVALTGEAKKVAAMQGMVDQQLFKLQIAALPNAIPNVIHVDISGLDIGTVITVDGVQMPEGCAAAMSTSATVVQGLATRSTIMLQAEAKAAAKGGAAAAAPAKGGKGGKGKK
jgi:large subunit ribosomal protein L25